MASLSTTTLERRRELVNNQRTREQERKRAQLTDPAWRQQQFDKKVAAANKQRQNRIAKQKEEQAKPKVFTPKPVKPAKPKATSKTTGKTKPKSSGKGLAGGRTPTADERRVMDKIGALPCECCARMGRYSPVISLHHTDGRTKPNAHMKTLPTCQWHHDTPASKEVLIQYPDLIPIHAKGSLGGKAAWREIFGSEVDMLVAVWEKAGVTEIVQAAFEKARKQDEIRVI